MYTFESLPASGGREECVQVFCPCSELIPGVSGRIEFVLREAGIS